MQFSGTFFVAKLSRLCSSGINFNGGVSMRMSHCIGRGAVALATLVIGVTVSTGVRSEPLRYIKFTYKCGSYGDGVYYIPGTTVCLKFGGYVRAEGGWTGAQISGGTFYGIDTGAGGRTNSIDTPTRASGGQYGGTIDVIRSYIYNSWIENENEKATINPYAAVYAALRTGFITTASGTHTFFTANSLNPIPLGSVSGDDPLRWTIPVLAVYSFPTSSIGLNIPQLSAEIFGGINISRRKANFTVTELGAPGTPAFSVSESWTTVDPAVGFGLQYELGKVASRPVSIGASTTFDWTKSHTLTLQSPNFPTESYRLDVGRRMETSVRFNVSYGLYPEEPAMPRKTVKQK